MDGLAIVAPAARRMGPRRGCHQKRLDAVNIVEVDAQTLPRFSCDGRAVEYTLDQKPARPRDWRPIFVKSVWPPAARGANASRLPLKRQQPAVIVAPANPACR